MVHTAFPAPTAISIADYPAKLQTLIQKLQQTPDFTPAAIKHLVQAANLSARDLMPWADFNHPVTDSYGRQLVLDGGHFEIMVMSWRPNDFSAIHDHGTTQWGAVQCFGAAEHYIYTLKQGVLRTLKPAHYSPGMVHAVDHSLIHHMGNPGTEPFLSLHVYGSGDSEIFGGSKGPITGNARIFDVFEGCIQYTDGGVFFGLPDTQINQRQGGLIADQATTLRHHLLMCDRIRQILNTQQNSDLEQTLLHLQQQIQHLSR